MKNLPIWILLLLAGCQALPNGPSDGQGASRQSHPLTVSGKLYTQNGDLYTQDAKIRVFSVTPGNPLDTTVDASNGGYTVPDVPSGIQVRLTVTAGAYTKGRLLTLLNGSGNTVEADFGGQDTPGDAIASSYALDAVWCSPDPNEDGYHVAVAAPGASGAVPVYRASEIPVYQSSPLTGCMAHPVAPHASPGMDVPPQQAPLDTRLIGSWHLSIPSTGYVDAAGRAQAIDGASLGTLTFQPDGSYTWGTASGKALQVLPHNGALPDQSYWAVTDDAGQAFYIWIVDGSTLTLYAPGTNMSDGTGTRTAS